MVCLLCGDPRVESGKRGGVRGVTLEGIAIRARRASVFRLAAQNFGLWQARGSIFRECPVPDGPGFRW